VARFPKEIGQVAKWVAAALGAVCDPNRLADAERCPRVGRPRKRPKTDGPARPFGSGGWRCPKHLSIERYELIHKLSVWYDYDGLYGNNGLNQNPFNPREDGIKWI
jgi:hypothetical protein